MLPFLANKDEYIILYIIEIQCAFFVVFLVFFPHFSLLPCLTLLPVVIIEFEFSEVKKFRMASSCQGPDRRSCYYACRAAAPGPSMGVDLVAKVGDPGGGGNAPPPAPWSWQHLVFYWDSSGRFIEYFASRFFFRKILTISCYKAVTVTTEGNNNGQQHCLVGISCDLI